MKKWYALLTGKKILAFGLTTLTALTALLAVAVVKVKDTQNDLADNTPVEQSIEAAENIDHEIPSAESVGDEMFADNADRELQEQTTEALQQVNAAENISVNLKYNGSEKLQWPVAGRKLVKDFSMDSLVYYPTLKEYKVCPAIMIQAEIGDAVLAPADCMVSEIGKNEEIGSFIKLKLSDNYEAVVGNLKDIKVQAGSCLLKGTLIAGVEKPTKYYINEGTNLYFEIRQNEKAVDPLDYLD